MAIRTKRWTRVEYDRLIDLGAFGADARVELLGGQLVVRQPQGSPHATAVRLAAQALRHAFGPGWIIEGQLPVSLDDESEPEPDVTVVSGGRRYYIASHPSRPVLVDHVLEVYRDPGPHAEAPYGWRYASALTLEGRARVRPVAAASAGILVADLLP